MNSTGIGRRELLGIAAAGGVLASRPSAACTIAFAPLLNEIVTACVSRISAGDFKGVRRLLGDRFSFQPSLSENRMDADHYIEWLRDRPKLHSDGIEVQSINQSARQIVQKEYVRFEDSPPEKINTCTGLYRFATYIAVYDVDGRGINPVLVFPSGKKRSEPDIELYSAIVSLRYIPLPFEAAE